MKWSSAAGVQFVAGVHLHWMIANFIRGSRMDLFVDPIERSSMGRTNN